MTYPFVAVTLFTVVILLYTAPPKKKTKRKTSLAYIFDDNLNKTKLYNIIIFTKIHYQV